MSNNYLNKDEKYIEKRRKIFRIIGLIGSVVSGVCNLLMIIADDFDFKVFLFFLSCIFIAIISKKDK